MVDRTKKPVKAARRSESEDFFAQFGQPQEETDESSKREKATAAVDSAQQALIERIGALDARLTQVQSQNMALMSSMGDRKVGQPVRPAVEMDLSDLPDPLEDPKGYSKAFNARLQKTILDNVSAIREQEAEQNRLQAEQAGKVEAIWADFSDEYAEYAENQDKVSFAAEKALTKLSRKGVANVQKYMEVAREDFFKSVVKEYDNIFGKPNGAGAEAEEDGDNIRTSGVFGGSQLSAAKKKTDDGEDKGGLVEDIHTIQRKLGLV